MVGVAHEFAWLGVAHEFAWLGVAHEFAWLGAWLIILCSLHEAYCFAQYIRPGKFLLTPLGRGLRRLGG